MEPIQAASGLSFRVGFSGHSGHLRLEPLSTFERTNPINSIPDFILPPAFIEETEDSIKSYIEKKYLRPNLDIDAFSPEKAGRDWDFDWFDKAKVPLEPSLPRSVIVPVWELPFRSQTKISESQIWDPRSAEVDILELTSGVQDSGSLPRIVGPPKDFLRGSISNRPFRPGGLDDSQSFERTLPDGVSNGEWACELVNGGPAQFVPPSFKQGLHLGELKAYPCSWTVYKEQGAANSLTDERERLADLSVQFDDLFKKAWEDDTTMDYEGGAHLSESESTVPETETYEVDTEGNKSAAGVLLLDEILSDELGGTASESGAKHCSDEQQQEVWAVPANMDGIADHFHELVPDMALEFPFELDDFQKEAIYCLERGDSVFVSAHTSAGKTVVAEYAFALASKHCTRAIYTAPIKTISNQKYRDFFGKFDVGLLTGDVSLRPEASCLIMTTEILRSMLYRGADIIRDIEWVIFDEVHYVNDAERGVVWEEVIIMLPRHVNIILLSATVPNKMEFADWIGRTKQKKIRVTGTIKRPVPLEHCLFYSGELYRICENETFIQQGLKAAKDAFKKKNAPPVGGGIGPKAGPSSASSGSQGEKRENFTRGKQNKHSDSHNLGKSSVNRVGNQGNGNGENNWGLRRSEASLWRQLINKLSKKSLLPVVIFCFSKNRCDKSADSLSGIDLTSSSEKSEIRVFCDKAFSRLKGSDRNLPQIVRVQSLLRRGIGVHHAGLLPIVKEVIEMLFCRGVIKVLFSTETFAMGVNAPARTVVFDSLRKFDGKDFRNLLPGEYTQMAGRAGRRGLDKFGTVIVMCHDEIPEESNLRHVIVGSATKLESQFRLTYIMILHLLRVEELKVEDMLKRSFAEFHAQKGLSETHSLLKAMLDQPTRSIECIKGEPAIEEYYEMHTEADRLSSEMADSVMQSPAAKFLSPGRVVVVKSQSGQDHLLGVVIEAEAGKNQYIVLVLRPDLPSTLQNPPASGRLQDLKVAEFQQGSFLLPKSKRPAEEEFGPAFTTRKRSGPIRIELPHLGAASGMSYEVRRVETREFLFMCAKKIVVDQVRLLEDCSPDAYSRAVQLLLELNSGGSKYPPALHPVKDLKLKDVNLVGKYDKWNTLLKKITENKCHGCIKLAEHMKIAEEIMKHKEKVKELKFKMSDEALQQMPEFQGRVEVLKHIGCIDADLVVQIKGRVACEMNSGEELICTECLFENQLDSLEPEEAVALMSAFVFQQRNTSEPTLTPKLFQARQRLHETAIRLGELQAMFGIPIIPEEYAQENLKFGLVEVVYEWAKGTPFADICELTNVPEGLIVRTIVRLDETCREFKNAAAIMGNSALHKKMEAASNAIKRDIVFAASLYITGV